jgi:hypothetical protein
VVRAAAALRDRAALPLAATFVLLTLVHAVETAKFVTAWRHYRAAVAALAIGDESDPALGDPRFVSSDRIAPDLSPLSWFSTTPYLSVRRRTPAAISSGSIRVCIARNSALHAGK